MLKPFTLRTAVICLGVAAALAASAGRWSPGAVHGSAGLPSGGAADARALPATFPTDPDLIYFAGNNSADTAVSIEGEKFRVNGTYTYPGRMWQGNLIEGLLINSRMVNGVYDDMDGSPPAGMLPWDPRDNTEDYIAQMPSWKGQGLVSFTIDFQGGSNRCNGLSGDGQSAQVDNNPFGPGGTKAFDDWYGNVDSAHARYLARLGSVIRAADDQGMAVVLGFFYFGQDEDLTGEAAVVAAVDRATDWVLDNRWTNVIIEVNNEANIAYNHAILQPSRVPELIQRVATRSSGAAGAHLPEGHLLVSTSGGGGYIPPNNWVQASDFVLLHGNGQNSSGIQSMVDQVRARSAWQANPKPILFNEDSTNTSNFVAAVQKYAAWGYFDSDGYQCVYDGLTADRWTLQKATNSGYWPLVAEMTLGVGEEPPPPGSVVMEAEGMGLSGYVIDGGNPDWIMVGSSAVTGEAVDPFPGASGTYGLTINAVAENDGQSTLEVWIDGARVATFTYPLGTSSRQPVALAGPTLFIENGAQVRLVGTKDSSAGGTAHARVDNVVFASMDIDPAADSDGDGCTDGQELGPNEGAGGRRDPQNFWDFFDTPDQSNVRDRIVAGGDIFRVLMRFGTSGTATTVGDALSRPPPTGYHAAFDRSAAPVGAERWDLQAPDGIIAGGDISAAVVQFGHRCSQR